MSTDLTPDEMAHLDYPSDTELEALSEEREAIRREMAEESGAHFESDEDEGIWVDSPEYHDWQAEFYSELSEFDEVFDPYEY